VVIAHDALGDEDFLRVLCSISWRSLRSKAFTAKFAKKGRRARKESPAGASEFPTKSGSNGNIVRAATFHPIKLL
jgi:hypothetical protein